MENKSRGKLTKERILHVAERKFSELPYGQVSTRSIAADSGVDSAMIHRYFGSKEGLFRAVIENGIQTENLAKKMVEIPIENLGEAIIRYGIQLWSSPQAKPLLALCRRTLVENPQALYQILLPKFEDIIARKCAYSPEEVKLRVGFCFTQMLGFILARYLIQVDSIADLETEQVVQIIAPILQSYLTGPLNQITDQSDKDTARAMHLD